MDYRRGVPLSGETFEVGGSAHRETSVGRHGVEFSRDSAAPLDQPFHQRGSGGIGCGTHAVGSHPEPFPHRSSHGASGLSLAFHLLVLLDMPQPEGRTRVVVERVHPEVDCGRFPSKCIAGDSVTVDADIFTDGHELVAGEILYRRPEEETWRRVPMKSMGNDRWRAEIPAVEMGRYLYTVEGWIDHFETWQRAMVKRIGSGQNVGTDCLIGANLVEDAASRAVD